GRKVEEGRFYSQRWIAEGEYLFDLNLIFDARDREELGYYIKNNHLSSLATCRTRNGLLYPSLTIVFWNIVKLEVDTMKLKQAKVQFAVDQSLTGNMANSVLNEMKLSFILKQKNNAPVIGSKRTYPNEESTHTTNSTTIEFHSSSGSDKVSVIGTPPQSNFTPPSNSDKVRVSSQIGSILPDGTVLPKPPPQPNFIQANDSDEVSFSSLQMTFDDDGEETPDLDSFISSVPTNTQKWDLPSGKSVNEIYFVNVSQYLSAHMRDWFSDIDIQHMMKDHVEVLTVPALDEEVNAFIADVEK
ncbi:23442_t:CDS:2, partial [Racocetra persica]